MKSKLILLRHGESVFNQKNIFTGWVDIPLSEKGIEEARAAGKKMKGMEVDVVFTSTLTRAHMTTSLAMLEMGLTPVFLHPEVGAWEKLYAKRDLIPVHMHEALNERMYGALQGKNKKETADEFGERQVKLWRRSYDVKPPRGESLEMTAKRTLPYFKRKILPLWKKGKNVLVSAHGNSLRAIIMYLDNLSKEEVIELEVPTGKPIIYDKFR